MLKESSLEHNSAGMYREDGDGDLLIEIHPSSTARLVSNFFFSFTELLHV